MSICDNTTVNQETTLKLQSIRKTKICRNASKKKLLITLKLDGVPRYFIKKVPRYRYSVPSTDGTGKGTKKVPRYFCTRYCPPMLLLFENQNSKLIRKVYINFLAKTYPNKCSVCVMFERTQKEVLADGMKLHYK